MVLTWCRMLRGPPVRVEQEPVEVVPAGAVQELPRADAAEHLRYGGLHVVEDNGLPARVEVVYKGLYALEFTNQTNTTYY